MNKFNRFNRPNIDPSHINDILNEVGINWKDRCGSKGSHIFVSKHEIDGVVSEEVREMQAKVVENSNHIGLRNELMDIVIAALHGIASIDTEKMDW